MIIVNKIDRHDARPDDVHTEIFDLFANLGATDEQLDFPTLFAVGREGWAVRSLENEERKDLTPLFETTRFAVPVAEFRPDARNCDEETKTVDNAVPPSDATLPVWKFDPLIVNV